ncbi:MAG: hypothetical protein KF836_02420 [Fimbriimonadaceae bacterium]|nr:hypothetical protein [Fimbriimonadaceae bacterium]
MWGKSLQKQFAEQWEHEQKCVFIDFRTHDEEDLATWDYSRRAMYLINEDALPPYCLDKNVWSRSMSEELQTSLGYSDMAPQLEVVQSSPGQIVRAWNSCEYSWNELVDGLKAHLAPGDVMIGYSPNLQLCDAFFGQLKLLGYDVSDWPGFSVSGICNCGYDPEEKIEIKKAFGHLLTDRHLFIDADSAVAFALNCDERVSEHAQFRVNAIYQLA